MNVDFNNLNNLIKKETLRALRETLDSQLNDDNEERRRQQRMAKAINKRKLHASDDAGDVDEAEEEVEEEVEVEEKESGVPDDTDSPEGGKREDRSGGKGTADSPKLKTPSIKQIRKASVGSVIDKLNAMRGGRSLKDPEVKKSFKQYFDSLTTRERESLLVFLTGMAQILAGTADGEQALDPGDVGLRVKGSVEASEKQKDKDVAKKKTKSQEKSSRPGSESAPIVVGESQNKFAIKKMLEAYRRYK